MKTIKNNNATDYSVRYPVLWKRLLNFLEDCHDVDPSTVEQKKTFAQLGLSAEDCGELTMNLELTTGLYGFANGTEGIYNMRVAQVLNLLTSKNNFKDIDY